MRKALLFRGFLSRHRMYSALVAFLFVPFVYAMFFTFPHWDDFARSNTAWCLFDIPRAIKLMVGTWFTWSGRYSHHFLIIFFGKMAMFRVTYTLMCMVLLLGYWLAFHRIFAQLSSEPNRTRDLFLAGACTLSIYVTFQSLNLPYYLMTDILGLGAGNLMVLVHVWSLLRAWNEEAPGGWDRRFVYMSGAFAIGCYEHAAIAIFFAASSAALIAHISGHAHRKFFLRANVVLALFVVLSLLAPGNFMRQENQSVTPSVMFDQLRVAPRAWTSHAFAAFGSLYAAAAVVVSVLIEPRRSRLTSRSIPVFFKVVLCCCLYLLVTGSIVMLHALSSTPILTADQSKLTDSLALLGGCILCFSFIYCLQPLWSKLRSIPDGVFIVPFLVCVPLTSNFQRAMQSTCSGKIEAWAASMETRKHYLSTREGQEAQVARMMLEPFPSTRGDTIPGGARDWPARDAAEFYQVRTIESSAIDRRVAWQHFSTDKETSTSVNGIGAALFTRDIQSGKNVTYARDFIYLEPTVGDIDVLWTMTVLEEKVGWLLPNFLETAINNALFSEDALNSSWWMPYTSIIVKNTLADNLVEDIQGNHYLIPVSCPEWGEVFAVYISKDGLRWRRVRQ